MRFESQWLGDAIASPTCSTPDLEDASFESLGDRSWVGIDRRSDEGDAEPTSAPSSQRRPQPASVDTDTSPTDPAGWRECITSIPSIAAECCGRSWGQRCAVRSSPIPPRWLPSSLGVYGGMNENFVLVSGRSRWQADGV
jgi:hypothetical protein